MFRAVLFDLGGVIFDSPFDVLAAMEAERGLAAGSINAVIIGGGDEAAWGRHERGELGSGEFLTAFQAELDAAELGVDARELMAGIRDGLRLRPRMVRAVGTIRRSGLLTAAVTNNWREPDGTTSGGRLADRFDAFIESAVVGVNKPDPRIYRLALDALGVAPAEAVFLDDIGRNLKSAAALGITTIKVGDPDQALEDLGELLGIQL